MRFCFSSRTMKFVKNISAIFVSLLVIIATSGFGIYSHECDCCRTSTFSPLPVKHLCDADIHGSVCDLHDEAEQMPCCASKPKPTAKTQCSQGECCMVKLNFHRLNQYFHKQEIHQIQSVDCFSDVISIIDTEIISIKQFRKLLIHSGISPPIPSVEDFVIFSSALKIPF